MEHFVDVGKGEDFVIDYLSAWDEGTEWKNERIVVLALDVELWNNCDSTGINPEDPGEKSVWPQRREVVAKVMDARKLNLEIRSMGISDEVSKAPGVPKWTYRI